jgi:hypothetical protein
VFCILGMSCWGRSIIVVLTFRSPRKVEEKKSLNCWPRRVGCKWMHEEHDLYKPRLDI